MSHSWPSSRASSRALTGCLTCLALFLTHEARAGSHKAPDVLLLVDTSGSMQYSLSGDGRDDDDNQDEQTRWAVVAQALTGTLQGFSIDGAGYVRSNACRAQQNTADPWFASAFANPWDWPVHTTQSPELKDPIIFMRASSSGSGSGSNCAGNSGNSNGNSVNTAACNKSNDDERHDDNENNGNHNGWYKNQKSYSGNGAVCTLGSGGWDQASDGVLDLYARQVRFGLMTSDTGHLEGTDLTSYSVSDWLPSGGQPVSAGGSYWYSDAGHSWLAGTGFAKGLYGQMTVGAQSWEVGSRNPYVAPWEGRLMGFGAFDASSDDIAAQNERIQRVILSRHPIAYGSSYDGAQPGDLVPMSAMLSDAYDFLVKDGTVLGDYPTSGRSFPLSSANDPSFLGGCRPASVVVISSGRFGGDMRAPSTDGYQQGWFQKSAKSYNTPASCASGGACPYMTADYYANKLATNPGHPIAVSVFGAVSKHRAVQWKSMPGNCPSKGKASGSMCQMDCDSLAPSDFGPAGSTGKMCSGSSGAWDHDGDPGGDPRGTVAACCELANLAIQIDPSKPPLYFIDGADSLKQAMTAVITSSPDDDTARTIPALATAAPTIQLAQNPSEVGPGGAAVAPASFELLSSLSVGRSAWAPNGATNPSPMWRGVLERRRLSCSNASSPTAVAATIDPSRGDDFAQNLVSGYATRKFFTVVAASGATPAQGSTLRRSDYGAALAPTDPNADGLGGIDVTLGGNQSALATSDGWYAQIAARLSGGLKPEAFLGITSSSLPVCGSQLGANNTADCANLTLRWFGGYHNDIPNHPSDRCPHAACSWVSADYSNQNPLGALYHASPVVIGPPNDYLDDEAYRSQFAVKADATRPSGQATRPTMLYAATIDGQLHAFVVAKNSDASDYSYAGVPKPDGVDNGGDNELWSFVPPAVLRDVWPNFNSGAVLLDGPLVVRDVLVRRSASDAALGKGSWRTILVGSGGASVEGGFYYALDVTNPTKPEFLWQLRTAGSSGVSLFGASVPAAEIATIGVKSISGSVDQVAVAILPGGTPSTAPPNDPQKSIRAKRRCTSCNASGVRGAIREWGDSVPARSLTIVELATGRVLKRFEGRVGTASSPGDLATTDPALVSALSSVRSDANAFDSPITSAPIAFPNTPGVRADRAYVGDADGTLWRLDLHDPDPTKWTVDIAWDAYGASGAAYPALAGQPIASAPVVSVDSLGNPSVLFATGDQDGYQTFAQGMQNYLVSLLDKPSGNALKAVEAFHVELSDGERVTGPVTLFGGVAYFASYAPSNPSLSACSVGTAKVWGLDFLTGAAGLDTDATPGPDAKSVSFGSQSVIFGVEVSRTPSCAGATTVTTDGWLAGNYAARTKTNAGSYELVLHTGPGDGFSTAFGADALLSNGQQGAATKSLHVKLPTPKSIVKMASWAAVAE